MPADIINTFIERRRAEIVAGACAAAGKLLDEAECTSDYFIDQDGQVREKFTVWLERKKRDDSLTNHTKESDQ